MAAKAAERRAAHEQAERDRLEREQDAYLATMGPCPCPFDPCPMPPQNDDDWWCWSHREHWAEWDATGRCPACQAPMPTSAQAREHDCPNAIALAAS